MITLATNVNNKATTQFTGWHFNSYAKMHGKVLCASEDGLFYISGDSDDSVAINASFTMAETDFGIQNSKRFSHLYFIVEAEADFLVDVTVNRTIQGTLVVPVKVPGFQTIRIPCTRVFKGKVWTFKVRNKNGKALVVHNIKGLPTVLHPGRS